ncbi:hypothetical protein LPJ78_005308 [Coemansia sp. RSA 989]|nr:hypothetical protein BX667DRAFT_515677 [Coemansia mojavensis]KAJ1738226.1 hypothetical protein LPJ68_005723 [Coemansia sp. RSA 1086]KAJ1747279.1 hypothetical protein LPJ79_005358 [Coemansia sp. RSA 1821]KAJ1861473.1 hypothetical protein LPJ78_005308 [Coemansia sp. RSA 989]
MVSFVCNYCQETIKKPKLDAHTKRCRNASFSCIDCGVDFAGTTYRQHTSCMTEAEKYEGKLHKKNKSNAAKPAETAKPAEGAKPADAPKSTVDQLTAKAKQLADQQPTDTESSSKKRTLEGTETVASKRSKWYKMEISEKAVEAVASAIAYCVENDPAESLEDLKKKCVKMVCKHSNNNHRKANIKSAFKQALMSALSDGKIILAMPSSTS